MITWDALIRNACANDGSGGGPERANLAIRGDQICAIGEELECEAQHTIDADGLVLAPGFIRVISRPSAIRWIQ